MNLKHVPNAEVERMKAAAAEIKADYPAFFTETHVYPQPFQWSEGIEFINVVNAKIFSEYIRNRTLFLEDFKSKYRLIDRVQSAIFSINFILSFK